MATRSSTEAPPVPSEQDLLLERLEAATRGMGLSVTARYFPDRPCIYSAHGERTYGELNGRANQLARALRERGLKEDSVVALICANRPEFAETFYAGQRSGFRTVPVNWHLTAEEGAYIATDADAVALLADARFAETAKEIPSLANNVEVCISINGPIEGFEPYEDVISSQDESDLTDAALGRQMLYTSGTTGRPKGVWRPAGLQGAAQMMKIYLPILERFAYVAGEDVHLTTGPLYHSAPLVFSLIVPLMAGVSTVLMDGWSPEETLQLIERYRVTHTHMVPTMFHRLLSLPEDVRKRYDLSSLRFILHGAAPCPVATKQAMMDWLGPIVHEYYAATEGLGTHVTPEEWFERPGTVGKPEEEKVEVRDAEGRKAPPGEVGTVYIKSEEDLRFEYYKDPQKTAESFSGDYFTLGDMGYMDEDGYLYLADRTADLIISGGVNIYPAEVDAVLLGHPAVADVATIGIPNEEWGEEVRAVVELKPEFVAGPDLANELVEHCRQRLAHYKCPKAIDFTDSLPRHDTGKIYRRLVREPYWNNRAAKI